jgi:hypothetical protein
LADVGPEVFIFMISMNCQLDFDSDFWSGFDAAMIEEWNITATTSCREVEDYPSNLYGYKSLANKMLADANSTTIAGQASDFTTYINSILGQSQLDLHGEQVVFLTEHSDRVFRKSMASGVAYPTENLAFVENNLIQHCSDKPRDPAPCARSRRL